MFQNDPNFHKRSVNGVIFLLFKEFLGIDRGGKWICDIEFRSTGLAIYEKIG
jgi:hypothetical protein